MNFQTILYSAADALKKSIPGLLCLLTLAGIQVFGQDIPARPEPPRLVNDFAGQLNATEIQTLEQKLVAYYDSTSTQIAVVVVKTTGDYPIADYALKIGREWGVGQQGKNNGIVMLWASDDRKIYIATGYGMEGALPDAITRRIISQIMVPNFQNGMFYKGLDKASDAIIRYASGEYKADPVSADDFPWGFVIFLVIFFIILMSIWGKKGGGGGPGGGRYRAPGPVFWPYTTYSGGGRSSGSWGGGGWSGGGGGGFGGFGGGSFGGGGSGGSY